MKPEFAGRENNVVTFNISYEAEEFDAATLASFKANRDRFVVDGFRRGKAPRSIIEKRYGEGVFFEDAILTFIGAVTPIQFDIEAGIPHKDESGTHLIAFVNTWKIDVIHVNNSPLLSYH